jgi:DNA-binding transcriptional LysR family regulator
MPLELRQLRHLLALADHGSFGRAATALRMTQPALSRSVKAVEEEVGVELFHRSVSGVTPTDHGRLLIQHAGEVVRAADELDGEILRRRVPGSGELVVGAGPYPGETIVPAALTRFVVAHPLVRVRIVIRGDWDELLRRLRTRELEFFIAETSTLAGEHDLDVELLEPHPVYFVARRSHPLARRKVIGAQQTAPYPFLALSRYPPRALGPMLTSRQRSERRPERAFPAIELPSVDAAKRVLEGSDAIAPLPVPCVAGELERGTLTLLGTEPWLFTGYGLVRLKGHAASPAASHFVESLREADASLVREESRLLARHSPKHRKAATGGRGSS